MIENNKMEFAVILFGEDGIDSPADLTGLEVPPETKKYLIWGDANICRIAKDAELDPNDIDRFYDVVELQNGKYIGE